MGLPIWVCPETAHMGPICACLLGYISLKLVFNFQLKTINKASSFVQLGNFVHIVIWSYCEKVTLNNPPEAEQYNK